MGNVRTASVCATLNDIALIIKTLSLLYYLILFNQNCTGQNS